MTDREAFLLAFGALGTDVFLPGNMPEFQHIYYCRFCSYSREWVSEHGHGKDCLFARLQRHADDSTAEPTK